ncbi:MAG TPA: ABC transporter permease [Trueperaceae bacterium]|nr:ABC transporter permease [Trueperaceae bacterium]
MAPSRRRSGRHAREAQRPIPRARASLDPLEIVLIAFRSIRSNLLRSALTTLGVVIGVAAVVALTAAGSGVNASVTDRITSLGSNLLTVTGAGRGAGSRVRGAPPNSITLADAQAILALDDPRIAGIAPQVQINLSIQHGANTSYVSVVGTWPDYQNVRNTTVSEGAFFTQDDNSSGRLVAVLGYQVAQDLFGGSQRALGQSVRIGGLPFDVIGVLPDKGDTGFMSPNSQVLVPLTTFVTRVHRDSPTGTPRMSAVYVQGSSAGALSGLQQDLTTLIASRHRQSDPANYDFRILNQADQLATLNSVTGTLTLFLGSIAGISLLVGGIGIMNIMLVSVTERTREIGVRKALGAKPRDILAQFLLEATMLSVGGGILGILAGIGLGAVAGHALSVPSRVMPQSILIAFLFAAAVGIFFGLYPAQRAARLDPVESLRYE